MLNIRDLRNNLTLEEFSEHPIENSRNGPCHIFSVNNIGYLGASPDFMKDGRFDLEQYCFCLVKTVLMLPTHLLSPFLDHQCNQLKRPFRWLSGLEFQLTGSGVPKLFEVHEARIEVLYQLIQKKQSLWTAYVNDTFPVDIFSVALVDEVRKKYNFDLVMQEMETKDTWNDKESFLEDLMEDYRLEVEWDDAEEGFMALLKEQLKILEESKPPKKKSTQKKRETRSVFDGSEVDLTNYFSEYRRVIDKNGKLMCKDSTFHFVEVICNGYVKSDGSSFDQKSILNHLENYDKSKGRFWDLKSTLIRA